MNGEEEEELPAEMGVDMVARESSSSNDDSLESSSATADTGRHFTLPLPRDHSYLVASHPLVADGQHIVGQSKSSNSSSARCSKLLRYDLAILELFGVVLFPGSTIPVKLRDRTLIEYLGRQIAVCRELPHLQSEVRLGILTLRPDPVERRRGRSSSERSLIGRIGVCCAC